MKLKYIRIVSELIVDEGEISEGNMTERNMSYKQKKLERKPQTPEELEAIVEEEVRELVGPYAQLVKKLSILVDTKKPDTRNQIFKWLLENPETLKTLNQNVDKLINIVRT